MSSATQQEIEKAAEAVYVARPQIIPSTGMAPATLTDAKGTVALPVSADALEGEIGQRALGAMDNEPAIASADFLVRALTLASGHALGTAVEEPGRDATPEQLADYALAEEMRLYMERAVRRLETPLSGVVDQAVGEAWGDGHKLFEKVAAAVQDDDGSTQIQTVAIKPKPREGYRIHVTRNFDVLGATPGSGGLLALGLPAGDQTSAFVPLDGLFLFTLRGKNGDPRGRGAKRAAYDAWYRKQQAKPESLRHASLFGSGRVSVEGPDPSEWANKAPKTVKVGGRDVDLIDWLSQQVGGLAQGSYIVLTGGYRLKVHNPAGNGEAFELVFDRCDREMTLAYLTVTRATQEAKHGSKADSETAEALLAHLINYLRTHVCEALREQYLVPDCAARYGLRDARRLAPRLLMTTVEQEDVPALLSALAQAVATGKLVTDEQLPYWDRRLGQPERDLDETKGSDEEKGGKRPEAKGDEQEDAAPEFSAGPSNPRRIQSRAQAKATDRLSAIHGTLTGELARIDADATLGASAKSDAREKAFDAWETDAFDAIAKAHRKAAEAGVKLGGQTTALGKAQKARLSDLLAEQGEFLADFREAYENGDRTDAQAAAQLAMYAERTTGTANAFFVDGSPDDATWDWTLGGAEAHCEDCPRLAAGSPYTKDTLYTHPGGGDTACVTKCTCGLRRNDGVQGFSRAATTSD